MSSLKQSGYHCPWRPKRLSPQRVLSERRYSARSRSTRSAPLLLADERHSSQRFPVGRDIWGQRAPWLVRPALRRLSPTFRSLVKELDKFGPLFGRQCRKECQRRREQFALKAPPCLSCFVEQPGRRRLVRVRFGELGPGSGHQRLDGVAHPLHMRPHVLGILIERLSLLWIECKLCSYPQKPFSSARRQRGT